MRKALKPGSVDSITETIAANLDAELTRQRWSGRKAALALGLTPIYVNRRTNGDVECSGSDLVMFAEFLDIPVSKFFEGTEKAPSRGGLRAVKQQGDEPLLHFAPRPRLELGTCRLPATPGNTDLPDTLNPVIRLADRRIKEGHTVPVGGAIISSFPVRAGA